MISSQSAFCKLKCEAKKIILSLLLNKIEIEIRKTQKLKFITISAILILFPGIKIFKQLPRIYILKILMRNR